MFYFFLQNTIKQMAEAGEIDESSTQKRPFIPNIEEPAENHFDEKKLIKGVQNLMKYGSILFKGKK